MIKENASMKLWEACLDKSLFKDLLEEIVSNTSSKYFFDVVEYCYERYSHIYPDVLLDVFSDYRKNSIIK